MLHMRLAEMTGNLDVDGVADSLTSEQLAEWWAYGCLNGWFINPEATGKQAMDANESMQFFQRLSDGRNNNT